MTTTRKTKEEVDQFFEKYQYPFEELKGVIEPFKALGKLPKDSYVKYMLDRIDKRKEIKKRGRDEDDE